MNHGDPNYNGFPMGQMQNQQKKMAQYQKKMHRLQNSGKMHGIQGMKLQQQMMQQQQQFKAYQQMMQSGQFPFQPQNMMKPPMMGTPQPQGMVPPMPGMGQMPGQFMPPNQPPPFPGVQQTPNMPKNQQMMSNQHPPMMPNGMDTMGQQNMQNMGQQGMPQQGMQGMGQPNMQGMNQQNMPNMSQPNMGQPSMQNMSQQNMGQPSMQSMSQQNMGQPSMQGMGQPNMQGMNQQGMQNMGQPNMQGMGQPNMQGMNQQNMPNMGQQNMGQPSMQNMPQPNMNQQSMPNMGQQNMPNMPQQGMQNMGQPNMQNEQKRGNGNQQNSVDATHNMQQQQVPPPMMPQQNFGMPYNMQNSQFPMSFPMQQMPPSQGMPFNQNMMKNTNKKRSKKHSAPSEIVEPPKELPAVPTLNEISAQQMSVLTPNDKAKMVNAITNLPSEKRSLFFRVFGCVLKRKEATIDNFIEFFAANCFNFIPNAVNFLISLAEQFKRGTNVFNALVRPPCPLIMTPLSNHKIQYQIIQCCPNGADFNLLSTLKKGSSFCYGTFISLLDQVPPVNILVDNYEVSPVSFGDKGFFYPISSNQKHKINVKFPPLGNQIKWFVVMYACRRPAIEVLQSLMEEARIRPSDVDKIYAQTPQCPGCHFEPLPIIEQAFNGNPVCPHCGKLVILSEMLLVYKPCISSGAPQGQQMQMSPQMQQQFNQASPRIPQQELPQQAPQPAQQYVVNQEEEEKIKLLGEKVAVMIRPKPESIGWTKAVDVEPFECKRSDKLFYCENLDDLEKSLEYCDDYCF